MRSFLSLLLAISTSGHFQVLAKDQVLATVTVARPARYRVCAKLWNTQGVELAVHVEAGAVALLRQRSPDIVFELCGSLVLAPGAQAELRLVADAPANGNVRVVLEATEVFPEGT